MAKNQKTNQSTDQKVLTKYDRKLAERKKQEEKNKQDDKKFKIGALIALAVCVVVIIAAIITPIQTKKAKTTETFIQLGDRAVTELEFDYYYNSVKNSYLPLLSYTGVDVSGNFESAAYSEDLTWRDVFTQDALAQMKQVFALSKDAAENGYSYDATEEYESQKVEIAAAAAENGITVPQYYKVAYGSYATEENIEPFVLENIIATAYYNYELMKVHEPSAEEIEAYYLENQKTYDKVDYRYFAFSAELSEDAAEKEITTAMNDLKKKADSFLKARKSDTDFEELCIANASEDTKADYEDAATEKSLVEGGTSTNVPSAIQEWLYDDSRKEGDITVIEDTENHQYHVVEFISKYYNGSSDVTISNLLSSNAVTAYVNGLMESFALNDVKGNLKDVVTEPVSDEQAE